MSGGIFDGIFSIVHRTFLLSYFRGCWLLDFFCAQSMWTYNEAAIELATAVFLNDYNSMAMSFMTKLNFWQRKLFKIQLDSSLQKHPFLLALRCWGRFARRNVCDSATEIPLLMTQINVYIINLVVMGFQI